MQFEPSPEMEKFIEQKIAAREYAAASDVLNAALSLLKEQERLDAIELEELRRDIQSGLTQLDNGEGRPWDPEEAKSEGRKLRDARRRKVS